MARTKYLETRLHELIRRNRWDEVRSYLKTPEGGAEAKRCRCVQQCPQDLGEGAGRRCASKPLAFALYWNWTPAPADIISTLVHLDAESAKMMSAYHLAKYDKTDEVVKTWLKVHPEGAKKRDNSDGYLPLHVAALHDKTGNVFKNLMDIYPEAVFDVGAHGTSPLELAAIYNKPTAELFRKHAFETVGQEDVLKFLEVQGERERERRKKEREQTEPRREKEREQMKRRHKEEREEMEGRHKKQCEEMEGRHKRKREEEREEERKDEREELEREHKRKRKEEREEREREHERKNDCPICLEALNAQECACTPCGHIFHRECVGKSLRSGSAECPTCREKFRSLNLRTIYLP